MWFLHTHQWAEHIDISTFAHKRTCTKCGATEQAHGLQVLLDILNIQEKRFLKLLVEERHPKPEERYVLNTKYWEGLN